MSDPAQSIRAASCADDYDPNSMPVAKARFEAGLKTLKKEKECFSACKAAGWVDSEAAYEALRPDTVPDLLALYDDEALFKDPFNEVRGQAARLLGEFNLINAGPALIDLAAQSTGRLASGPRGARHAPRQRDQQHERGAALVTTQ